jgi:hypothetical protein
MKKRILQLTLASMAVSAALDAQAALYTVVEVTPTPLTDYSESYGSAIAPSSAGVSCFSSDCAQGEAYSMGVSTLKRATGIDYKRVVPFGMDSAFRYVDSRDGFLSYCQEQLGYQTCEAWADANWAGYAPELAGDYANGRAAVEPSGRAFEVNTSINALTAGGEAIGNSREGKTYRNRAFVGNTLLGLPSDTPEAVTSQAFHQDSSAQYVFGSISRKAVNSEGAHFSSKPAYWLSSDLSKPVELNWGQGGVLLSNVQLAQGAIRAGVVAGSAFYGVGFNTYYDQRMDATVFTCARDTSSGALSNCVSEQVKNATSKSDDNFIYSNTMLTGVNSHKVAVGSAKLNLDYAEAGAAANKLFYVADVSKAPYAQYLQDTGQGIFFAGAGGKIGNINNNNEIVGQIDVEKTREKGGKPRRQRGFIYPLKLDGVTPNPVFGNQAWILDDLTNDNLAKGNNNQFRVVSASDINDAGVISATALKCEGGYDNISDDSYCGGGNKAETIVAVKLVPINGATASDIKPRVDIPEPVSRSGGFLGLFPVLGLALLYYRRRK